MFQRLLQETEIARQVALLINNNNDLNSKLNAATVLANRKGYIVESSGTEVVACVKLERQSYNMSEIKHLVVISKYRKCGLAKRLVLESLKRSTNPIVYATVRKDNIPSQKVFQACGFINSGQYTTGNKVILLYIVTSPKWRNALDRTH
jgi:ribosomal protein S18 acetylase RimI-like enzyme